MIETSADDWAAEEDWINKPLKVINPLRKDGWLRGILTDIQCGLHSGFKPCCISFFILISSPLHDMEAKHPWAKKLRDKLVRFDLNIDYIACPLCVHRKSFVKVKDCPSSIHIDGDHSLEHCIFEIGNSQYKRNDSGTLVFFKRK